MLERDDLSDRRFRRRVEGDDSGTEYAECASEPAKERESLFEEYGGEYCAMRGALASSGRDGDGATYQITTESAPRGVTTSASTNAYAAKLHNSPGRPAGQLRGEQCTGGVAPSIIMDMPGQPARQLLASAKTR